MLVNKESKESVLNLFEKILNVKLKEAEIKQAETELQKIAYEIANFDALKKAATSKVEETSRALEAAKQASALGIPAVLLFISFTIPGKKRKNYPLFRNIFFLECNKSINFWLGVMPQ